MEEDRVSTEVPQASRTEMSVLGAVMAEGNDYWSYIGRVAELQPNDLFYNSSYRMIADAIARAVDNDMQITESSITDQLIMMGAEDKFPVPCNQYLRQLEGNTDIFKLKDLASSVQILTEKRQQRQQLTEIEKLRREILSPEVDLSSNSISQSLSKISISGLAASEVQTMSDIIADIEKREIVPWVMPTGVTEVDNCLGGGYAPGRLYVIAARPKVGKTTLMMNSIVTSLEQPDTSVIVVTMETMEAEFYYKMLSTVSGVPKKVSEKYIFPNKVVKDFEGNVVSVAQEDYEALEDARSFIDSDRFHVAFPKNLRNGFDSIAPIILKAQSHNPNGKVILYLDYLQLLVQNSSGEYHEISQYTRGFKVMAMEFGVPVVILSQLNRGVNDGEMPSKQSFRGSGSTEQDVDGALLLNRKSLSDPQERKDVIDVWVTLNREGEDRTVTAFYNGASNVISDLGDTLVIDDDDDYGYDEDDM